MNPDQQIELYRAARAVAWSYRLEQYDAAALKDLQRIVDKSKESIVRKFADGLGQEGSYTRKHYQNTLKELERLTLGLRNQLGEELTTSTSRIGSLALREWGENLSVGGLSNIVNTVALSPEQFKAFFIKNPPAGILIPKVMRNAMNRAVTAQIQGELLDVLREGALTGQSYKRIVDTLEESFTDFNRTQLTTLTRTFFQTANAQAFDAVYQANQDIVEGKIWTNVNDDRVCLLCLPLGETLYKKGEEHPPMPRHPNCRCVFRAKTVSYRDLGIDVDELEEVTAPVVTRGYEKNGKWIIPPAGTGTGRRPQSVSFYKGGMKEAFPDLPEARQKAMLGVGRYNLYKAGDLTIDQMVDQRTGKLWLLKELDEGMHLRRARTKLEWAPSDSIQEATQALKEKLPFDNISILNQEDPEEYILKSLNIIGADVSSILNSYPYLQDRIEEVAFKGRIRGLFYDKTLTPKGAASKGVLATHWMKEKHIRLGRNSFKTMNSTLNVGEMKHNVGLDFGTIFRHEYGHQVYLNVLPYETRKRWESFFEEKGATFFHMSVSKYASTNANEAFAEVFAAITSPLYNWKGGYAGWRRLPEEIEEKLLSLLKGE